MASRRSALCLSVSALALAMTVAAAPAFANDDLIARSADPNQWPMPTGDYSNHRYSTLNQITADNHCCPVKN